MTTNLHCHGDRKNMTPAFSTRLHNSRLRKKLSQRKLAAELGLDHTYISKLENNAADYPPSEEVITAIAHSLDEDPRSLCYLAGRLPTSDLSLLQAIAAEHPAELMAIVDELRARFT